MKNRGTGIEWLIRLSVVVLVFLCCYIFIKLAPLWKPLLDMLWTVLTPFAIAAFVTYLLLPIVNRLNANNVPRPLAILLIYVGFFGALGYGLVKGVPYVIDQLYAFGRQIPQYESMYRQLINEFYHQTSDFPETVHDHFRGMLQAAEDYVKRVIQRIIGILKRLAQSIFTILAVPVLVFYFLNDYPGMKKLLVSVVPSRYHRRGKRLAHDLDESLGGYIRGQLFVCAVLAGIAAGALWLIGIPYAVLLGVLIGITDIIPYFGPILGAIPTLLVAATISWKMVLFTAGLILVLHVVEGSLLSPFIVGKSLHLHPAVILFALFLGGEIGGLLGMLLAVPLFAVLRVVWVHYQRGELSASVDK
ncbi:MAG TPA: AI-2E family transporter [Bacillales bacterium]|nr:AI-2E family transporter [Bacillales bacterium]